MAIINKDFKIKNGLVVEGSTGTINGYNILTKSTADQNYIIGLIGGSATPNATPDTVVLRDGNADFSANMITSDLTGDVTGTVSDISNHTTDSLAEGVNNEYYTDAKVRDVLTTATKTNITITEIGNELHITAENGVADSTTDDLTEGTTNKYFTDQRALDATASAYDAAGAATTAENNANTYTDNAIGNLGGSGTASVAGHIDILTGTGIDVNPGNNSIEIARQTVDTWYDASGSADAAEQAANLYTDNSITTALTTAQGYADTAEANANAYTDNAVSGLNWKQAVNLLYNDPTPTLTGDTLTSPLVIDGHADLDITDVGYRVLVSSGNDAGIYVYNQTDITWTLDRTTDADAYDELIGAAVYVMEGTQYGSTSWVQSNHYLTDFTGQSWTQFSGQGSVTAGTGITVDGLEVSVNRTIVDTWYDAAGSASTAQTNAENYADGLAVNYDPAGSATTAENNAKSYADGLAVNYDAAGSAFDAQQNAEGYTDAQLTNYTTTANLETTVDGYGFAYTSEIPGSTDSLSEGINNLYYTDARARTEAVDLLTNATKNNIEITYNTITEQLTVTAENGVADSTTDDLAEGSTNLYFTDSRAIGAVSGADITPNTVTIDTYRKEEATQQYVASASTVNVHTLAAPYESVKYLVRVVGMDGGVKHSQITEILMTIDGNNNIAITEYGSVYTSTNPLATFSAIISGIAPFESPTLTATTAVNGCEIIAAATMLSWAD